MLPHDSLAEVHSFTVLKCTI